MVPSADKFVVKLLHFDHQNFQNILFTNINSVDIYFDIERYYDKLHYDLNFLDNRTKFSLYQSYDRNNHRKLHILGIMWL